MRIKIKVRINVLMTICHPITSLETVRIREYNY